MTGIVVVITNYYTSMRYSPVQKIARASETGHATNIIAGLAVGPARDRVARRFHRHRDSAQLSFRRTLRNRHCRDVDAFDGGNHHFARSFGPITDNAGGIAVMSNLPKEVRMVTDELDAVGNTMKAVTKGYAIASAGLAALVLFGSYVEELRASSRRLENSGWRFLSDFRCQIQK